MCVNKIASQESLSNPNFCAIKRVKFGLFVGKKIRFRLRMNQLHPEIL